MHLTIYSGVILFTLIAFASFVDSVAGGGGLITIPSYLAVGVPAVLVLGTNKFVSTAGTGLAVYRLLKFTKVHTKLIIYFIFFSFIGSILGAVLSHVLTKKIMVYLLSGLIPILLAMNILKRRLLPYNNSASVRYSNSIVLKGIFICIIIGAYDGFFGPGTGTFLFLAFSLFLGFAIKQATVYARVINFISNAAALSYFLMSNLIDWKVITIALPAALIGSWCGSNLVIKGSEKWISWAVVFVLVLLLVKSINSILV